MMETNCRIGKVTPKGNLVLLPTPERLNEDLDPNEVLRGALGKLSDVVVVGWDKENDDIYVKGSMKEFGQALTRLEQGRDMIMYGSAR